jgi:hypothetical protein
MKVCKSLAVLSAIILFSAAAGAQSVGEWSKPVDGLRGRLSVREGKPYIGTRMLDVYLELENVSDVANPIELYFDTERSIVSRVVDVNGNEVAQPQNGASIALPPPFWIAVPSDGDLRFRVSVSGYGVYKNSGTQIQMNSGSWLIKPGDKNWYFLEASLVSRPPASDKRRAWSGELKLPKILISGDIVR